MIVIGNICVMLMGLGSYFMFKMVTQPVSRYDYWLAIIASIPMLISHFGAFAAITSAGKLDFLGCPRPLQYCGVAIACVCMMVLMGFAVGLHGSGGREFPWGVGLFTPWAAYTVPLLASLIAFLWLNSERLAFPESLLRGAFAVLAVTAVSSNIVLGVETRLAFHHRAEERDRSDLQIVQTADAEKDFDRLLHHSSKTDRSETRRLALQKLLSTGARFDGLITVILRNHLFQEGLIYLRDNDPPGDPAPLAEPARDAVLQAARRLRASMGANAGPTKEEITSGVDTVLTVAAKFTRYGADFVPAVREYRAALDVQSYARVPSSSREKLDTWLRANSR